MSITVISKECPKCGNKIAIKTPYETFCENCGYIFHKEEIVKLIINMPKELYNRLNDMMKKENIKTIIEAINFLLNFYEDEFIYGVQDDEYWEE